MAFELEKIQGLSYTMYELLVNFHQLWTKGAYTKIKIPIVLY